MNIKEVIGEAIYTSPIFLLSIKDKNLIDYINNHLPYSIGIEIECSKSNKFDLNNFTNIPNILDVNIDDFEQRFRIPNGLKGLICLYNICEQLSINSKLNLDSGHHYHIDMTNTYHLITDKLIKDNKNWILNELDSWNYLGNYNSRNIEFNTNHNWVRFQKEFKTAEFRIGNMTFDYNIIVKRLIHASDIIKKLNNLIINKEDIIFEYPNINVIKINYLYNNNKLNNLYNKLNELNNINNINNTNNINDVNIKEIIKNRIIKI
jgi:hypothetical protein